MKARLSASQLASLADQYQTPYWVYDASVIRAQIARLRAFDVIRFAQKACNIHILKLMREEGVLVDSVSLGEVERALAAGFDPLAQADHAPIVFTADVLDQAAIQRVTELNIPVNCGSPQMLEQLGKARPGHPVWLRINPGLVMVTAVKPIPAVSKANTVSGTAIWIRRWQLLISMVCNWGLHMHIGSGVDYSHLQAVGNAMVAQVKSLGRDLKAISVGGGLSIPYRDGEAEVDTDHYFTVWQAARREIEAHLGHAISMEIEPGRFLVAESGLLVAELRAQKQAGNNFFALVDAGFNDLARPAMYGGYHRISVCTRDGQERTGALQPTVVAGRCANPATCSRRKTAAW
jgi:diaminopimelate decarboxylase